MNLGIVSAYSPLCVFLDGYQTSGIKVTALNLL